jgi:metallo-beta-lactamase class B
MPLRFWAALLMAAAATMTVAAQAPAPAPAPTKPDTPAITARIEQLRKTAGPRWATAVHFYCEAPRANAATDPPIEPTKIFDNVYAIGNVGTTVYVIGTSAGLLMIDALPANQLDTQLLPGFQKLGLDPSQVKVILVSHGHPDHFGGSAYFQEHFGSKVYMADVDWPKNGGPKHEGDLKEGEPVVLGDVSVSSVAIPGHTPGSMGFIFPVKDNGRTHTAALFGGSWLTTRLTDEGFQTYIASVKHFEQATRAAKVDVMLQNHPLMDDFETKLAAVRARRAGQPNPFIVGADDYQKFLQVMETCSEIAVERRKL